MDAGGVGDLALRPSGQASAGALWGQPKRCFRSRYNRIYMYVHRIRDAPCISSREGDGEWHAMAAAVVEDQRVASAQAFDGERETAELIFAEWVGTGDVENKIRTKFGEAAHEMGFEDGEIVFVADAIGKIRVET